MSDYTDAVNRAPAPPPVVVKAPTTVAVDYVDAVNRAPAPPPVVLPIPIVTPTTTAPKTTTKSYVAPTYSPSVAAPQGTYEQPTVQPVAPKQVLPPIIVPTETQTAQIREAQFTEQQIWLATPEGTKAVEAYQEPFIAAAAQATPQYAVTYTEGGVESTVVFNTKDKAEGFAESIREPDIAVSSVKAIPGPGAGPASGSLGSGVSATLTGALMSTETWFASLSAALRAASTQQATAGAEAKSLAGLTGGFTAEDATSALFRFGSGVVEGAAFALRPVQWAQLASLPVAAAVVAAGVIASGAATDWRSGARFLTTPIDPSSEKFIAGGGVLLEVAGAGTGAVFAGKALNAAGKYVKSTYTKSDLYRLSEAENFKKLYPLEGQQMVLTTETRYMMPLLELVGVTDDAVAQAIIRTPGGVDAALLAGAAAINAASRQATTYQGSMSEAEQIFDNEQWMMYSLPQLTLNQNIQKSREEIAAISASRLRTTQAAAPRSVSITEAKSEQRTMMAPVPPMNATVQIQPQIIDVYEIPVEITEQTPDIIPIQTPIETPITEPIEGYEPYEPPPEETTKQGFDASPKTKGKIPIREAKRLPGESLFSVTFTYARGGETRTVSAKSYTDAYAKAERSRRASGQPAQVRIVKI